MLPVPRNDNHFSASVSDPDAAPIDSLEPPAGWRYKRLGCFTRRLRRSAIALGNAHRALKVQYRSDVSTTMCAYMSLSAPVHARMVIDPAPDMPQNADEGRHDLDRLSLIPPAHLGPITSAHISALLPHLYVRSPCTDTQVCLLTSRTVQSPVASDQSDAQCPPSQRGWIPLCDSGAKSVYAVGYCGMIVAIKHAHAHDAETRSHFSRTLVKEAQALTQARHPNIVQLMGTTRVAGNPALVLEHVGPSLGDLLGRVRSIYFRHSASN